MSGQFVSNLSPGNFGTDGVYVYQAPAQPVTAHRTVRQQTRYRRYRPVGRQEHGRSVYARIGRLRSLWLQHHAEQLDHARRARGDARV